MVVAIGLMIIATSIGVFVVDPDTSEPEPAVFKETVSTGLALEDELGLDSDVQLPRAQLFYSQDDCVIGYYGGRDVRRILSG